MTVFLIINLINNNHFKRRNNLNLNKYGSGQSKDVLFFLINMKFRLLRQVNFDN